MNFALRKWIEAPQRDKEYYELMKSEFVELKQALISAYYSGDYEYMLDTLCPKLLM
jgi:hypothetical protein